MNAAIKIGTRKSQLALWQANHVAGLLQSQGMQTEIITMDTKGDKNLEQAFSEIGTKGIFTEEIEQQLSAGAIDIAVHSAKDMQSTLPEHLELIAFTERESPNDVLVSNKPSLRLDDPSIPYVIGTSSARRRAMLRLNFPHLQLAEARGNLQTRIRKMEEGNYDAMILAYAGIHRMKYDHLILEKIPLEKFIPAVGQGSMAIEAAMSLDKSKRSKIRESLNHEKTEYCIMAERAYLRTMEGGCSIPIFALATLHVNEIVLTGGIVHPSGSKLIRNTVKGQKKDAEKLGQELAAIILLQGGDIILKEIRHK